MKLDMVSGIFNQISLKKLIFTHVHKPCIAALCAVCILVLLHAENWQIPNTKSMMYLDADIA